jgi:hypothetical protein
MMFVDKEARLRKIKLEAYAKEMLIGLIDVMTSLAIEADHEADVRDFLDYYGMWRHEDPGDPYGLPTSHDRTIAILIERREFTTKLSPERIQAIYDERHKQALSPGTIIYVWHPKYGGLQCSLEGEVSKTRIPPRIVAGTRGKILSIQDYDVSSDARVELLDGPYKGKIIRLPLSDLDLNPPPGYRPP